MAEQRPPDPGARGGNLLLWFAAIVAVGGLVGWLASEYGDRFDWKSDGPTLGYLLLLLVLVLSSFTIRRAHISGALKAVLGWVAIGFVALVAYTYRGELKQVWYRVAAELGSSRPIPVETADAPGRDRDGRDRNDRDRDGEGRAMEIRQSSDGHFYVTTRINGAEARLLVDTGATVTVLSLREAERAGIFPSPGDFVIDVRTASGIAKAARADIRSLEIGEARLSNVRALVMKTPGDISVLGVQTLQRFRSYEVRDGVLTLRW
ncbi:MAG: TIGR02281 family clan AA aspartic protease [Rhodospirillaceae bacterium]|nr:TIGR02281 family clan AA aspartic protease [Rhodospirillaceae bacterium]